MTRLTTKNNYYPSQSIDYCGLPSQAHCDNLYTRTHHGTPSTITYHGAFDSRNHVQGTTSPHLILNTGNFRNLRINSPILYKKTTELMTITTSILEINYKNIKLTHIF